MKATVFSLKHVLRYNWLTREGHPTTVKADLAAGQRIERLSEQYRRYTSRITKLPLVLRHIVPQYAVVLEQDVQACELTYREWYQTELATVTRALFVSFPALMTSFGLGWNLDVITDEFRLNRTQVEKLTETLALALGPTKFVAGPLAILVDLVAVRNLFGAGTRQDERPGRLSRGAVSTKQPELHRTSIQTAGNPAAALVLLVLSSLVFARLPRLVRRRGSGGSASQPSETAP